MTSGQIKTFLGLVFALVFASCEFSTTVSKNPVFSKGIDTVQANLNKMVVCERFGLNGQQVTTNGRASSELEISVINGQDIPMGQDQMWTLAKSIASYIKGSLRDEKEYDKYTVLFVTEQANGGFTKRKWKGDVFTEKEL